MQARNIAGQIEAMKKGVHFGRKPLVTPELVETFKELREKGVTYKEIGRIYGFSSQTVSHHVREIGFAKRGTFPVLSQRLLGHKTE